MLGNRAGARLATLWHMTTLVLTVVGDDRQGLVAAVADVVDAHGGNWENSQLAQLAGAFAGIVQVEVPADRVEELTAALRGMDGLLTIAAHPGGAPVAHDAEPSARRFAFTVLGNDRPGIVREVSSTLRAQGVGIDRMVTETRDAAMSGGRLFEAVISAHVPPTVDVEVVRGALERLAAEIQVDVTVGE